MSPIHKIFGAKPENSKSKKSCEVNYIIRLLLSHLAPSSPTKKILQVLPSAKSPKQVYVPVFSKGIETMKCLKTHKVLLDKHDSACDLFMHLSNTFDTIHHDLSLAKPRSYGFSKDVFVNIGIHGVPAIQS